MKTFSETRIELVDYMGNDVSIIRAMLVSTSKEGIGLDNAGVEGRINYLMKNRHGTPFEHASMTFFAEAPLAVFYEWHRHRIGVSYNEESGRYTQLRDEFYVPSPDRPMVQTGKPGAYEFHAIGRVQYDLGLGIMLAAYEAAYESYEALLAQGWAKEIARMVLPVGIIKKQYFTCNPRSLMAFLSLRTRAREDETATYPSTPMYEIDDAARKMEKIFADLFPVTHEAFNNHGRVAP